MDVDAPAAGEAELDYGGAVGLEEDTDVHMALNLTFDVWTNSTLVINQKFCYKRWVDLLALNFVKDHQRRPENPSEVCRLDESEGDRFPEPEAETDASDDENDVIVKGVAFSLTRLIFGLAMLMVTSVVASPLVKPCTSLP